MKYFIDTEFIEGFHKPLFGKKRHFIDLISIGIVAEDGREYYAISNEFNPDKADNWVKDNVLYPIMVENGFSKNLSNLHGCLEYSRKAIRYVQKHFGKSNERISKEIKHFCNPNLFLHNTAEPELEFYGYYADYDWVLFCSLFGRMVDLPKGFPMYCKDLKQIMDGMYMNQENKHEGETRLESWLKTVKNHPDYPKQNNEHNALDDAKWNYKLFKFLNSYTNYSNDSLSKQVETTA